MHNKLSISFVILSYNQYENITSIINNIILSKIADYEIIVVDNNSYPSYEYELKSIFNEVIFINNPIQRNQSKSRNDGVKIATKDYICFIDGDDNINPVFFESLNSIDSDVLFIPRLKGYDINNSSVEINDPNVSFNSSAVMGIYKTQVLKTLNIWHEENKFYYYSEDVVFTILLLYNIKKKNISYTISDNKTYLYYGLKTSTSTDYNTIDKQWLREYFLSMLDYLYNFIVDDKETLDYAINKINYYIIHYCGDNNE